MTATLILDQKELQNAVTEYLKSKGWTTHRVAFVYREPEDRPCGAGPRIEAQATVTPYTKPLRSAYSDPREP